VGFVGKYGKYVDQIGVLLAPIAGATPGASSPNKYGPAGGIGGQPFDGKCPATPAIKQIEVKYGWFLGEITVTWNDGSSETYQGNYPHDDPDVETFVLDDDEYLIAIDGATSDPSNGYVVKNIRFTTNKRVSKAYGPTSGFGGPPYRFEVPTGFRIFGFFCRAGKYIDAIGIFAA